jgi:apolipoprotein D and lipocalin family protein
MFFTPMKKYLLYFLMILFLTNCNDEMKPLDTVAHVDIDKYLGKWYEIARLPNSFEKGLICCTAEYSLRDDGKIKVMNSGHPEKNPEKIETATGKAWIPDKSITSRLKVQFFWPFRGDYYIFHLDDDYQYVLVGAPNRKYFWLLSRTPTIEDALYNELMEIARNNHFDVSQVYKTPQHCN